MAEILSYGSQANHFLSTLQQNVQQDFNLPDQVGRFTSSFFEQTQKVIDDSFNSLTKFCDPIEGQCTPETLRSVLQQALNGGATSTLKPSLLRIPRDFHISEQVKQAAQSSFEQIKEAVEDCYKYVNQVEDLLTKEGWQNVLQQALDTGVDYAKDHPVEVALHAAGIAVGLSPNLITGPVLLAIGMSARGPVSDLNPGLTADETKLLIRSRAGTLISAIQATFGGHIPAGSAFAACQRVAMTGKSPLISGLAWAGSAAKGTYQIFNAQGQVPERRLGAVDGVSGESEGEAIDKVDHVVSASPSADYE
ncbi:MAG: hypothetical protein M1812_002413 [Candelaria pacifica]|nr:MAG: hypothetical protein M1812_002413 [Candelaria pacifica]